MRNLATLAVFGSVLALAGCGENTGWNPNYSAMHNGSAYAKYLQEREVALHGKGQAPKAIPIQLPAQAPTPDDIAGTPVKPQAATAPKQAAPRTQGTPVRVGQGVTPVLVRYAHQETQAPGTRTYQRSGSSDSAAARVCRTYASVDAAQAAFIAAGGPVIDPHGMDPDGDGFVCGWDPRPFRQSRL
ncbi:hypothetical protein [Paracoccus sp. J56]|uniref:hypothetical protein n=1 Tax=Paracoccus sp. J56 TaxID=935850 RepID=UPI000A0C67D8|nr:hypothetical protein [Paracoccus sp. J56]SMG12328.1 hypothetical protein SAMN02746000_00573 [Paracoccus sp. J56]